jgi:hypothetical protein
MVEMEMRVDDQVDARRVSVEGITSNAAVGRGPNSGHLLGREAAEIETRPVSAPDGEVAAGNSAAHADSSARQALTAASSHGPQIGSTRVATTKGITGGRI